MKRILMISTLGFVLMLSSLAPVLAQTNSPYMNLCIMYKGIKSAMFIIHPDGNKEEVRMKSISTGFGVSFDKIADIQLDVLTALNDLKVKGWEVAHVTTISNEGFVVTTYLLHKN